MKKTLIKSSLFLLLSAFVWQCSTFIFAEPPSIDKDFLSHLKDDTIQVDNVKADKTFAENLKSLLYPATGNSGQLWTTLKGLAIWLILVYLVYAGAQLLISGKKAEDLQEATRNLGYIALGAVFIYGAGWLFGDIFNLNNMEGLGGMVAAATDGKSSLFFQILTFLKGAAFFWAILMIVITGFRVVMAADADKSKKLVRGVLNVVGALVIMKGVDFVYYIASVEDFTAQAAEFIISAARFFGYIYGALAVLMVFYAGYSFITDGGGGEGFKRAKAILINLLVSGLVLFGFLLILYQVFKEFT